MDIHVHAQLMAHSCVPRIADLVMRVPLEKPDDDNFQTRLIGSLVHGCQMSRNCRYAEAVEEMFVVTEHLFATAQPGNFDAHNQGHMAIVGMVSHASQMGTTTPEGAAEMLAAVHVANCCDRTPEVIAVGEYRPAVRAARDLFSLRAIGRAITRRGDRDAVVFHFAIGRFTSRICGRRVGAQPAARR